MFNQNAKQFVENAKRFLCKTPLKRLTALLVMVVITVSSVITVMAATRDVNLTYNGETYTLQTTSGGTQDILNQAKAQYPEIEVVQIQFNYLDYEDPAVQSKKCYEVCRKHNKPVLVMEPVKGGSLVNLPEEAKKVLEDLHGGSPASYAIRFAAGFEGIEMVLSGMSTLEQMKDNLSFMKDFKPLTEEEHAAVKKVCDIIHSKNLIPCTACRYCIDGCPKHISIPDLFACMNTKQIYHDWNADYYYNNVHTVDHGKASDCVECGKCEKACPQHLKIRELLKEVAKGFEKK